MADEIVVPEKPNMPNVPPLAAAAVAQFIVGLLVAFGLDVNAELREAILQGSTAALIILPIAEAWLRGRRATAIASVNAAAVHAQATVAAAAATAPAAPYASMVDAWRQKASSVTPAAEVDVRPYTDEDADADDTAAEAGVSPENADDDDQPDPGDPDQPSPTGDESLPLKPAAALPPDGAVL